MAATEATPLGDNGNPAYAEEVLKGEDQNNNMRNRGVVEETIAPPVEEVALGGDGNAGVLQG